MSVVRRIAMDFILSILAIVALIWAAVAAVIWVAVRQLRRAVDRAISGFTERHQNHVRKLIDAIPKDDLDHIRAIQAKRG